MLKSVVGVSQCLCHREPRLEGEVPGRASGGIPGRPRERDIWGPIRRRQNHLIEDRAESRLKRSHDNDADFL
jgi:hypothetical protein